MRAPQGPGRPTFTASGPSWWARMDQGPEMGNKHSFWLFPPFWGLQGHKKASEHQFYRSRLLVLEETIFALSPRAMAHLQLLTGKLSPKGGGSTVGFTPLRPH